MSSHPSESSSSYEDGMSVDDGYDSDILLSPFQRSLIETTRELNDYNHALEQGNMEEADIIEQHCFRGVEDGGWKIQIWEEVYEEEEEVITEEDILGDDMTRRCWRDLMEALRNHDPSRGVDSIFIAGIELSVVMLDTFLPAIAHLSDVTLNGNGFRKDGLLSLINFIEGNTSWAKFQISLSKEVEVLDMEIAQRFSDVLKNHTTLQQFNFGCYNLGERPDILCTMLDGIKNMNKVSFWHLELTSQGRHMANLVKTNPTLRELSAGCNCFNDNDANAFAHSLKSNTNLKYLSLMTQFGRLTEVGGEALLKSVFDYSSLDAVFDSNHTCKVEYDGMGEVQERLNGLHEIGLNRKCIIKYKILLALGLLGEENGCFNVGLLNDISVQLTPKVLNYVQLDDQLIPSVSRGSIVSLNNVYQVMRNCVAPLLEG